MEKTFYDKEGNPKTYTYGNEINHGDFGNIYMINNETCIKIFKRLSSFISEAAICKIKDLNLSNYYKIYDVLYDELKKLIGYTMKYYENGKIDILVTPTDYLITSFLGIYHSMEKINDAEICISDLRLCNVIMTDEGMVVIDVDGYFPDQMPNQKDERFLYNKKRVYELFKDVFYFGTKDRHKQFNRGLDDTAYGIFEMDQSPDEICKKLTKFKYPIDYLKRCR